MIGYRTFRNADPPGLLAVWKATRNSRATGVVTSCDTLESLLFSKPYFDPQGLFVAEEDGQIVGFSHAGFGASEDKSSLDTRIGAVYMVRVMPSHAGDGIGTSLLKLAQAYLHGKGCEVQYLGGMFPVNAFYLGLYGGSELPGILLSDTPMREFAEKHGYAPIDACVVYQKRLDDARSLPDTRIPLLRRTVEIVAEPWPLPPTWWDAALLGNIPSLRYEMIEKSTETLIGQAWVWEMECFGHAYNSATVGIINFEIAPSHRRRGYAKLLLSTMMKHLREQQIELVELQTMQSNDAARCLYEGLGFLRVDAGHAFRLEQPLDLANFPPLQQTKRSVPQSSRRPSFRRTT